MHRTYSFPKIVVNSLTKKNMAICGTNKTLNVQAFSGWDNHLLKAIIFVTSYIT